MSAEHRIEEKQNLLFQTIFEIKANKRKAGFLIMKEKRRCDQKVVGATRHQREEKKNSMLESSATSASTADTSDSELKVSQAILMHDKLDLKGLVLQTLFPCGSSEQWDKDLIRNDRFVGSF